VGAHNFTDALKTFYPSLDQGCRFARL